MGTYGFAGALGEQSPGATRPGLKLFIKRWLEPDPNWDLYRTLKKLTDDAHHLLAHKSEYAAAIAKCEEAIAVYPRFARAYRLRCSAYNNLYFANYKSWPQDKRVDFLLKAYRDATKNIQLHAVPTVEAIQTRVDVLLNLDWESDTRKLCFEALEDLEAILSMKKLSAYDHGIALGSKAIAQDRLGKADDAGRYYLLSLQTYPDAVVSWNWRAGFLAKRDPTQAEFHRSIAKALQKKYRLLHESGRKDFKLLLQVNDDLTSQDAADKHGRHYLVKTVDLEAGYHYQIDLKNPAFKTDKDYDPLLRLGDDQGKILVEDDDGGAYPNARIFFTASRTGSYRLMTTSHHPRQTGPFALTVVRIAKDK